MPNVNQSAYYNPQLHMIAALLICATEFMPNVAFGNERQLLKIITKHLRMFQRMSQLIDACNITPISLHKLTIN